MSSSDIMTLGSGEYEFLLLVLGQNCPNPDPFPKPDPSPWVNVRRSIFLKILNLVLPMNFLVHIFILVLTNLHWRRKMSCRVRKK